MNNARGFVATTVASMCVLCGVAQAGTIQRTSTLDDTATLRSLVATANGLDSSQIGLDGIAGSVGNTMNFATASATTSSSVGNFYLGLVENFFGGNNDNWFDGGANNTPADGTTILAFGNNQSATNSNSVTIVFNPGVRGFGFNYDDVESSTLRVTWSDGSVSTLDITGANPEGYISMAAAAGASISSLTLTQLPGGGGSDVNDGFAFYNFNVAVVPLPPAAWAGLAMLGGVAGVRKLRRR
jgi:hypothetical protein